MFWRYKILKKGKINIDFWKFKKIMVKFLGNQKYKIMRKTSFNCRNFRMKAMKIC